jgi:hypothetical protein
MSNDIVEGTVVPETDLTPAVIAPMSGTQLSRAMGKKWEDLIDADAVATTLARGGKEAEKLAADLASLTALFEQGHADVDRRRTVAGAYAVYAADAVARAKGQDRASLDLLKTQYKLNVSAGRVSQLRRYAKLIFDVRIDPDTDPEWGDLVRAVNGPVMRKVMDSPDMTREKLLDAFRKEQPFNPQTGRFEKPKAMPATSETSGRGPGTETAAEKTPAVLSNGAPRNNTTRIDAIVALLGEIVLAPEDTAEWVRLRDFSTELDEWLTSSPAYAEGMKVLKARKA